MSKPKLKVDTAKRPTKRVVGKKVVPVQTPKKQGEEDANDYFEGP